MKKKLLHLLIILSMCHINTLVAQEYDTVFHSNLPFSKLRFFLSDTTNTIFKITTKELKTRNEDTILNKVHIDTFYIGRINDNFVQRYCYSLSEDKWISIILGKKCEKFKNSIGKSPKFLIRWNEDRQSFEMENCVENSKLIKAALSKSLECIETLDDKYMKKHVTGWIEKSEDCSFQTLMFLQDLGHITSLLHLPIGQKDSTLSFSVIKQQDTSGYFAGHFYTKKWDKNGINVIEFGEDPLRSSTIKDRFMKGIYDVYKEGKSDAEFKRDSVRLNSIKDDDVATLEIDKKNYLIKYERYIYSSILDSDMKLKESKYLHIIEKLND